MRVANRATTTVTRTTIAISTTVPITVVTRLLPVMCFSGSVMRFHSFCSSSMTISYHDFS